MNGINGGYPIDEIRKDFPILSEHVHGKPLVYLDNGASAHKPSTVIVQIKCTYEAGYANVHRGVHHLEEGGRKSRGEVWREIRWGNQAGRVAFPSPRGWRTSGEAGLVDRADGGSGRPAPRAQGQVQSCGPSEKPSSGLKTTWPIIFL